MTKAADVEKPGRLELGSCGAGSPTHGDSSGWQSTVWTVRGQSYGWGNECFRRSEVSRVNLNPSSQKQNNENDDDETRSTAHVVVASSEAVAAAAEKQEYENNDENVHRVYPVAERLLPALSKH